jgi:hypothetical protein
VSTLLAGPVLAQAEVDERWRYYEQLAGLERSVHNEPIPPGQEH